MDLLGMFLGDINECPARTMFALLADGQRIPNIESIKINHDNRNGPVLRSDGFLH
jgi:hypothetical protein